MSRLFSPGYIPQVNRNRSTSGAPSQEKEEEDKKPPEKMFQPSTSTLYRTDGTRTGKRIGQRLVASTGTGTGTGTGTRRAAYDQHGNPTGKLELGTLGAERRARGVPNPFEARLTRMERIAQARADGTFDAKRDAFNAANSGSVMDEHGEIGPRSPDTGGKKEATPDAEAAKTTPESLFAEIQEAVKRGDEARLAALPENIRKVGGISSVPPSLANKTIPELQKHLEEARKYADDNEAFLRRHPPIKPGTSPAPPSPQAPTPSTGTPPTGTPPTGTPSTGTPSTGTPSTGTPSTGTPSTGTPSTGALPAAPPPSAANPTPSAAAAPTPTSQSRTSGRLVEWSGGHRWVPDSKWEEWRTQEAEAAKAAKAAKPTTPRPPGLIDGKPAAQAIEEARRAQDGSTRAAQPPGGTVPRWVEHSRRVPPGYQPPDTGGKDPWGRPLPPGAPPAGYLQRPAYGPQPAHRPNPGLGSPPGPTSGQTKTTSPLSGGPQAGLSRQTSAAAAPSPAPVTAGMGGGLASAAGQISLGGGGGGGGISLGGGAKTDEKKR